MEDHKWVRQLAYVTGLINQELIQAWQLCRRAAISQPRLAAGSRTYTVEGQGNQGSLMLFDSVPGHQILNELPAALSEPEAHLALAPVASYHSIRTVS